MAIAINPDYAFGALDLAEILLKSGDGAVVLESCARCCEFIPRSEISILRWPPERPGRYRGDSRASGPTRQAAEILRDAIERDPNNPKLTSQLASLPPAATTGPCFATILSAHRSLVREWVEMIDGSIAASNLRLRRRGRSMVELMVACAIILIVVSLVFTVMAKAYHAVMQLKK